MYSKFFYITFLLLISLNVLSQSIFKGEIKLKDKACSINKSLTDYSGSFIKLESQNKNLTTAALLSFAIPGAALGQFYKEEPVNGLVRVGISVLCTIWFFVSPKFETEGSSDSQKIFAIGIYTVNWIASIIDAATGKKTERRNPRGIYKINF